MVARQAQRTARKVHAPRTGLQQGGRKPFATAGARRSRTLLGGARLRRRGSDGHHAHGRAEGARWCDPARRRVEAHSHRRTPARRRGKDQGEWQRPRGRAPATSWVGRVDGRFAQEATPTGGAGQDRPDEEIRWAFEHKPDALSGRGTLGRGGRSASSGLGPHEVGDFPLVLSLATLAFHEYMRTPKVRLPLPKSPTV